MKTNLDAYYNRLIFNSLLTKGGLIRINPTVFYLDTVIPPDYVLTKYDLGYRSIN